MDSLQKEIENKYQHGQYSTDDLESLDKFINDLLKPVQQKKQEMADQKEKIQAWKFFFESMKKSAIKFGFGSTVNYLPLLAHMEQTDNLVDVRLWSGYYVGKRSTHIEVFTTPFFYRQLDKYYIMTDDFDEWIGGSFVEEWQYKLSIKNLMAFKISKMWQYIDCPKCDMGDNCKCSGLNNLDQESFRKLLDLSDPVIEIRNYSLFEVLQDDLSNLVQYHILDANIPTYKKNHHFSEFDYY